MTDANREADRLPRGDENQSIDHWARHGVEELTERQAEEEAELGVRGNGSPDTA
ncbi:MAG: hypothetical protein ABJD68_00340 [Nakamurella sp.]